MAIQMQQTRTITAERGKLNPAELRTFLGELPDDAEITAILRKHEGYDYQDLGGWTEFTGLTATWQG